MASETQSGAGLRVLLIDSNAALATAIQQVLQQHGFQADIADTGDAAKAYVASREPADVVVLDARVGTTDGHDLLNHIRSNARWRLVKIIMLTSLDSTHDVRRARKAGADDYLFKPVRPERLVEHVQRMAAPP